jgi:uncharacterized protein YceH (UPF0502 family)
VRTELTPIEARVIGCLIEKEATTPDQYPLSLNALTAACNQKSNRDPVLELSSSEVQDAVDALMKKHLVTDRSGGVGGRVTRYRHRFCNTQFGHLHLAPRELGIVCELLLRGPQTPGELRSRANRIEPLHDVSEVEAALRDLAAREEPLVAQLPREPGKRESRWMQLFTGEAPPPAEARAATGARTLSRDERIEDLEGRIDALEEELAVLRRRIDALSAPGSAAG